MKIVLNGCYGGFGLSYEAMYLYLQAKNLEAYFYADVSTYDSYNKKHRYTRVTLSDIKKISKSLFIYCTTEDQGETIDHFPTGVINFADIERTDPILVSVVETIGSKAASGRFAALEIHEISDGVQYKIDEYDGIEDLITKEDDDWRTATERTCASDITRRIENLWATIKPDPVPDPDLTF